MLQSLEASARSRPQPGVFYPWVLVLAAVPFDIAFGTDRPGWLCAVGLAICAGLYLATIRFSLAGPRRPALGTFCAFAVLTVAMTLTWGGWLFALYPLLAVCAALVFPWGSKPPPLAVVFLISGVALGLSYLHSSDGLTAWGATIAVGVVVAVVLRLLEANRELHAAREELARNAVAQERLRFARDLHDLLGHTLSLVVVKAEIIRRFTDRDPEIVAKQAAEVEAIGRDALAQIREAVTGYREHGLGNEIDGVRTALDDSGIELLLTQSGTGFPSEVEAVLSWCLREGVTNVIRHSGAKHCEVSVRHHGDTAELIVADDGAGAGKALPGNGLRGMSERLREVDGTVTTGVSDGGGFRFVVSIPVEGAR